MFPSIKNVLGFRGLLFLATVVHSFANETSQTLGTLETYLDGGSPESPAYFIFSPINQGSLVYRGPVKTTSTNDNKIFLYPTIDLSNPSNEVGVLKNGLFSTTKGRARALLDINGSIESVEIIEAGSGYISNPEVFIGIPKTESDIFEAGKLSANINTVSSVISEITIDARGKDYPSPPQIFIEGGIHYLKLTEVDSNFSGVSFLITANSESTVTVSNPNGLDLENIFPQNSTIEIYEGWTLGSILGFETTALYSNPDSELADWVYLLKAPEQQDGTTNDFVPYFHDGTSWKMVNSPQTDGSNINIPPDSSIMIARRSEDSVKIWHSGTFEYDDTFLKLPEGGKRRLFNNPFPTEIRVSDLFEGNLSLTNNELSTETADKWLAHENQEIADNLQVIRGSSWFTYWHDGTNIGVTKKAEVSVRPGSGIGGALTSRDFSMSEGIIENMTNGYDENITITSQNHGLLDHFWVHVSGVFGYKTDANKEQVNFNGENVPSGQGLIIESAVNRKWEVEVINKDQFRLINSLGDCDFISSESAKWYTGTGGEGYSSDALVSFSGEGKGATAIAKVANGQVTSIQVINGGFGYTSAPNAKIHSGGWKSLSSGKLSYNDLLIQPGSGLLMVRNHPLGIQSQIRVKAH